MQSVVSSEMLFYNPCQHLLINGIQNHTVVGDDTVGNSSGCVSANPVFDDSFALEYSVISLWVLLWG